MRKVLIIAIGLLLGLSACIKQIPIPTPYILEHKSQYPPGRYTINTHPYFGVGYVFDLADDPAFQGLDVYVVHDEMELALLMAISIDTMALDLYFIEEKDLDYDKLWLYLSALVVHEVDIEAGVMEAPEVMPSTSYAVYTFTYDFSRIFTVENTIDEWTYELKSSYYSDYQKAESSLVTLLEAVDYDDEALKDASRIDDAFTALGVFDDGLAVCNGYSQAYMGLLKDLNVPAIMVGSDVEDHAWNLVYVDEQWSYVDSTWEDDRDEDSEYWSYFLIDKAELDKDHRWDSGKNDTLNATDYTMLAQYVFPQTKNAQ